MLVLLKQGETEYISGIVSNRSSARAFLISRYHVQFFLFFKMVPLAEQGSPDTIGYPNLPLSYFEFSYQIALRS